MSRGGVLISVDSVASNSRHRPVPPSRTLRRLAPAWISLLRRPTPTNCNMEDQANTPQASIGPRVANLVLGAESFAINSEWGILSEQLATMKEKSMLILKEYITKHNAPNDVPDESVEGESDERR